MHPGLALFLLGFAGTFTFFHKMPRICALFALVGTIGLAGRAKDIMQAVTGWAITHAGDWLAPWVGTTVTFIVGSIIIIGGFVFALMVIPWKKGLPASALTAALGVVLALMYLSFPGATSLVWNTVSGGA